MTQIPRYMYVTSLAIPKVYQTVMGNPNFVQANLLKNYAFHIKEQVYISGITIETCIFEV